MIVAPRALVAVGSPACLRFAVRFRSRRSGLSTARAFGVGRVSLFHIPGAGRVPAPPAPPVALPTDRRISAPLGGRVFVSPLRVAAALPEAGIDDELHLTALPRRNWGGDDVAKKLDQRINAVQLPERILAVDAQVRSSWLMLGREPRSTEELLMVYAGIMAHGTNLSAAECARMMPQLSAAGIRQAMRWAADERRLAQTSQAVLSFMQRHPIAELGPCRSGLRRHDEHGDQQTGMAGPLDPRRNTASVGIYSHVRDRWGVFHAQPFVLNQRQAGVLPPRAWFVTNTLGPDSWRWTHGYSDFAMTLSRVVGFDHVLGSRAETTPPVLATRDEIAPGERTSTSLLQDLINLGLQ